MLEDEQKVRTISGTCQKFGCRKCHDEVGELVHALSEAGRGSPGSAGLDLGRVSVKLTSQKLKRMRSRDEF